MAYKDMILYFLGDTQTFKSKLKNKFIKKALQSKPKFFIRTKPKRLNEMKILNLLISTRIKF